MTGSTQGIGKAIAAGLAECGAHVFVHGSRDVDKCRKAAAEVGRDAEPVVCDLSEEGCAERLHTDTGDIDILVLNASIQVRRHWNEITGEEFDRQMRVNFKSSLQLIQRYAPAMRIGKWGRILSVGSVQQRKPHPDMLVYAASKCAQLSMVKNLAKQLAPDGITVNNLAPGVIATPRNDDALGDCEYAKKIIDSIPLGFVGESGDCTGVAVLLCSEGGRYITGADIVIDGGMCL